MPALSIRSIAIASLIACGSLAHAASAPDAGDYTPLPAGTDLGLVYVQHITADQIKNQGQTVLHDADLSLDVGVFRWVHFAKWQGYTIDPQIIMPFGQQKLGATGAKAQGLGDVSFGGTLWTLEDHSAGQYLGWSLFLTAPTGSDKDKGFALSDNRWAADFQVGYIQKLAPKWTLDLIGQVELYQDRRDTNAQKDPLARGFAHLRYHLSDTSHIATSLRYATGAEEKLNGTTLSGKKDDLNLGVTWATFVSKQVQIQLQAAQDLHVENGPKTRALTLRTLYVF